MTRSALPHHLLAAATACCQPRSGPTGQPAITIALQPFLLDGQAVDTCIRLDTIALDLDDPRAQARRTHRFPVNPEPGYIDGRMYLLHRHVPLDVTELAFGTPGEHTLPARLAGTLAFSAAGIADWPDTSLDLAFTLELPPAPASPSEPRLGGGALIGGVSDWPHGPTGRPLVLAASLPAAFLAELELPAHGIQTQADSGDARSFIGGTPQWLQNEDLALDGLAFAAQIDGSNLPTPLRDLFFLADGVGYLFLPEHTAEGIDRSGLFFVQVT